MQAEIKSYTSNIQWYRTKAATPTGRDGSIARKAQAKAKPKPSRGNIILDFHDLHLGYMMTLSEFQCV